MAPERMHSVSEVEVTRVHLPFCSLLPLFHLDLEGYRVTKLFIFRHFFRKKALGSWLQKYLFVTFLCICAVLIALLE